MSSCKVEHLGIPLTAGLKVKSVHFFQNSLKAITPRFESFDTKDGHDPFAVVDWAQSTNQLTNCSPQVSSLELVQEIHQLLMDREDCCHRTCFSLQLDSVTMDNFAELKSIEGLQDGSVIKVVEGVVNVCGWVFIEKFFFRSVENVTERWEHHWAKSMEGLQGGPCF